MSDDCYCDFCKAHGRRPRMHPAPKDWFYLEAKDEDDPDNVIIVWACSKECALALFNKGPGPRWSRAPGLLKGKHGKQGTTTSSPAGS